MFSDVNVFYNPFKGFTCIENDNDLINISYYCWKSLFGSVSYKGIDKKSGVQRPTVSNIIWGNRISPFFMLTSNSCYEGINIYINNILYNI